MTSILLLKTAKKGLNQPIVVDVLSPSPNTQSGSIIVHSPGETNLKEHFERHTAKYDVIRKIITD